MRTARWLAALVIAMDLVVVTIAVGAINVDPDTASAAGRIHAKVAIIVGPVGTLTDDYRALAEEAAAAARARTDDVVTVYSPAATWPAARAALTGASVVVYLGHGNGWPSPYRDQLYGRTQNGLGLNPVAGVDDSAHQYFGESYLSAVHLAPGAVVILGHLCYASGNPEPGGAEPTVDTARQRVDNYAAGWMAAGAVAVIAEGHGHPAYYVRSVLQGKGSVERSWRSAPTFHDHVLEFASERTSGAQIRLDPDAPDAGFYRALTVLPGARLADTLRGAATNASTPAASTEAPAPTPDVRALATRGVRFGVPSVVGGSVADTLVSLTVPMSSESLRLLPNEVQLGTRWDPIGSDGPSGSGSGSATGGQNQTPPAVDLTPDGSADPSASDDALSSPTPSATTEPTDTIGDPPVIDLIEPEAAGKVVTTQPSVRGSDGLSVDVTMPLEPGLYRLVTTIHGADGVAFDAATQDLLGALIIRVTGSVWATYAVEPSAETVAGRVLSMRVRVANPGTAPWAMPWSDRTPLLVVRWVGLDDISTFGISGATSVFTAVAEPGSSALVDVVVAAPSVAGAYLLLLDIQDGDGRSLAALGVPPGIVRVQVSPATAGVGAAAVGP